ncbi:hypothetical protein RUND412_008068 [Rhizina undulata]
MTSDLPFTKTPPPQTILSYLRTPIALRRADIPLLASTFVSGLVDASIYNAWAVFAAMQTGNTIFLSLGASNQPVTKPWGWLRSLIAISSFLVGALTIYRFATFWSRYKFAATSRGVLFASFMIQSSCVFIAAGLVKGGVVQSNTSKIKGGIDFWELLPLGFLAAQFGGQIASSRLLGVGEIPTTVLTSVYTDLITEPLLLQWPVGANLKRNRRAGSILCMLVGGIVGGWISNKVGLAVPLLLAGGIKTCIALCWLVFPGKEEVAKKVGDA